MLAAVTAAHPKWQADLATHVAHHALEVEQRPAITPATVGMCPTEPQSRQVTRNGRRAPLQAATMSASGSAAHRSQRGQ